MPELAVIDCSVAVKWVLQEAGTDEAVRLLSMHRLGEISLIAPDLLLAEAASLLARKVRRKQLPRDHAVSAFGFIRRSTIQIFDALSLLESALSLSLHQYMSVWDSVYLALAVEKSCPFVTADQRLFRAGRGRHPTIRPLI